ncbi:MAG: ORC-CDC6 family AAA ATPase [Luteibacter jiangsuensis]
MSDESSLLRRLFGDNRAEWPTAHFRELFVEPTYLGKLQSLRPCILVGGRGTGKTTSLQALRFDSTHDRLEADGQSFADQSYLGVLVRMNKNRVRAFQGSELSKEKWAKFFAHYVNLLVCLEMTQLAHWVESKTDVALSSEDISRVSSDLALGQVKTLDQLQLRLKASISELQVQVNNPAQDMGLTLSVAEAPLRTFAEVLRDSGGIGDRIIFCCIDEYENLLDYQQAVLNTYVKHAEPPLSYKVGVRKNGLRNRQTLDAQDLLKTPDDYAEIEIAEEGFEYFARAVGESRLKYARDRDELVPNSLREFLEELSLREEAELLGAPRIATEVMKELSASASKQVTEFVSRLPTAEIAFLKYWQETESGTSLAELATDWVAKPELWSTRFGNYGFSSLFWMSRGIKGLRIRKYYCGERVILALAGGNIRYFLELIDGAIAYELEHWSKERPLILSAKSQTLAARDVGRRRLNQLEGLADNGTQLKRMVLAIGKVFFELARSPAGRTPEVTSFVLSGSLDSTERVSGLLSEGVGHLAFEADPRTKATTNLELRDDEYRLHRIFCAFFEISHRKKRRITFKAEDLLAVLDENPAQAISKLLDGDEQSEEEALPEQLAFFLPFYEGGSRVL